jgi:hypothetical protein
VVNLSVLTVISRFDRSVHALSSASNGNGYAATSSTPTVLSASVIAADARTPLLETFLNKYGSPMSPYANLIVEEADKYGFDFRLLPAIAMCESNLGKHVPLKAGFNPFGIAVYTGTLYGKNFESWEHAITWVSQYISDRYYSKGITALTDIQQQWAPPAAENGNSWANCVQFFENSIL